MNRKTVVSSILIVLFVVSVFSTARALPSPTTYYVNVNAGNDAYTPSDAQSPSTPWKTISHAVSTTSSGDTINVAPGIYDEAVYIDKMLRLIGQPGAVIQPDNTRGATPIFVAVDGVTIQGFEIDGTHSSGRVWYGIYAYNTNDLTIQNNIIHDMGNDPTDQAGIGILVVGLNATVNNNMISGNTVYNTARMGIFVGGWDTSPLIHLLSSNNTISYNEVYHTWQGPTNNYGAAIQMESAKESVIKNNEIYDTTAGTNYYGVWLYGSSTGNVIQSNCVYGNSYGIVLSIKPTDVSFNSSDVPVAPAVHYNVIYLNSKYDIWNIASPNPPLVVDATNNWWGSNAGPDPAHVASLMSVNFYPWLVIGVSANPATIIAGGSGSTITADMTKNNLGMDTSGGGRIPGCTLIQFSTNLGSLTLTNEPTTNSKATTTVTSLSHGTATVTASAPPYAADATVSAQVSVHVDWSPMFRHDLNHTGYSTSAGPTTNQTLWKHPTGNWVGSSPAVVDGVLFVGSGDKYVYALNATTGTEIWKYPTGDAVISSPAVADGKVYIGSGDMYVGSRNGKIYCLNASSGAFIWSYPTGPWVESSPAVADGIVFVGSGDNNVYALNASNGLLIWRYPTGGWVVSSPAVVGGTVFVGSNDTNVYALNAYTGTLIWKYTTSGYVDSSPAVADGTVFVGSYDHNVYALNVATGGLIWRHTTGGWVESSPAVVGGVVFVGSDDWNVYALNASTGAQIWKYRTVGVVYSSPAVADSKVYVGSWNGWGNSGRAPFYCLDASTGAFMWSYETNASTIDSPATIAHGVVYIGGDDFNVYAFGTYIPTQTYDVTINGYCSIESADVSVHVAEDGSPSGFGTPHTFYGLDGSHTFSVPSTDAAGEPFVQWSTGQNTTMINVSGGGTLTAFYGAPLGTVIRVPEDYKSIQAAVNAASPWSTILIGRGVYNESIVVDKPLIIVGKLGSEPIFNGGGSGIAITLLAGASGSIIGGIVMTNFDQGILIKNCSGCKIYNNIMPLTTYGGIVIEGNNATGNLICNNIFRTSIVAINLTSSSYNNTICNNIISSSSVGVNLASMGNTICANIIAENDVGMNLSNSNNMIYHNDFENNSIQTSISMSTGNTWDNGYPSGGNYWSDNTGLDTYSGPNQDQTGSDGIVDTPYTVAGGSVDRYPLAQPFNMHDVGITDYAMSKTVVGKGYTFRMELKILNHGMQDENVAATVYVNASAAAIQEIALTRIDCAIVSLTWNTTNFSYGNYTVCVCAGPVQNETDTTDNNCPCNTPVHVGVPGDVSSTTLGVYDGKVNMRDITYMILLFNTKPGLKDYNPNADVNGDATVNMRDITIAILHFNQRE